MKPPKSAEVILLIAGLWTEYREQLPKAEIHRDGEVIIPLDKEGRIANVVSMEGFMDWLADDD